MASVKCPKCGAPVDFDAKVKFIKCSYCSSQIHIDRAGAGFYYALPFRMSENDAVGIFRRWAGGSTKAKNLEKEAEVGGVKKQYFPVYLFKRDVNGQEQVFVEAAGSTTLPGLHSLKVPGGDMVIFDNKFDPQGAELIQPDIEMTAYMGTLPGAPKEQALVFFPIWTITYAWRGKSYQAVVSANSGEVFAADFPKRSSSAYLLVAIIGFVAFIAEGILAASYPGAALMAMAATVVLVFVLSFTVAKRL
jgi:hypothetical protein